MLAEEHNRGAAVIDATERLVNLAMYLAAAHGPVTRQRIRVEVPGYPPASEQDEAAYARMLERDKKDLRAAGLVIESDAEGNYRFDAAATFAAEVTLTADEAAAVRAVGLALLGDPSFPFAADLRFALAKIATALDTHDAPVTALMADEEPVRQAGAVADLSDAASARKLVRFAYTNSLGQHKDHEVEPYGLFVRDGRWYLVGRDSSRARGDDDVRVYTVARIERLAVETARPETPDFERPTDFDVAGFIGLPFQYGPDIIEATLIIDAGEAWRVPALTAGKGSVEQLPDGSMRWRVTARNERRLMRWVIENGPGLRVVAPPLLAAQLNAGLTRAAATNGGA